MSERSRTEQLLVERANLLECIATGRPLEECLNALTSAVARLQPHARAAVLLPDEARTTISALYAADIPPSFAAGLRDAEISALGIRPCDAAVFSGKPLTCVDIAHDEHWSQQLRDLWLEHGILACHIEPVIGSSGEPLASLMLCFAAPHTPDDWEARIAQVGAHIAGIAIERDRSAQSLRESEEQLAAIFHSTAVGVAVLTPAAQFEQVNEAFCRIVGHSREELLTMDSARITHPDDLPVRNERLTDLLAGRIPTFVIEQRYLCKDGSIIWAQNSVSLVRDAAGQPLHLVVLCQDITRRKQAEEGVAHLAAIVTSAEDAIASKTLEGIVTSWNASAQRMFGYSAEEMIGQPIIRLFPPDRLKEEDRILARIRAGDRIEHFETVRVTKDGKLLDVSLTISPVRDGSGKIIGASKIVRDITERKRLEQELDERFSQLEATFESMVDGVAMYDSEGRIVRLNSALRQLLALDEAYTMRSVNERVPGLMLRDVTGRPLSSDQTPPARVVRGETFTGADSMDMLAHTFDGRDLELNVSGAPVRDADGRIIGGVCVYRDVTARRQAEEAVRESEEKFRAVADNIPTLAWMARPDGYIVWYNRRWYDYTGTTPESQEGWGWQGVHDPDLLPQVVEQWRESLASGEPFEMVFPLRGADGVSRPFLTRALPLRDDQGQIVRWFGTNTDVSEQRAAEEALRAANQRMDEFLHMATHELKTPLTAVQANLQIIERAIQRLVASTTDQPGQMQGTPGTSGAATASVPRAGLQTVARFVSTNQRQVQRLARLVDDLVDAARIQAEKLEIKLKPCDLVSIVREAVAEQRAVWPDRQILLDAVEGLTISVQADADRVGQVVTNYLTNALKYSPVEQPVEVALHADDTTARVTVRDHGPGIPAEEQEHIWERGHRVPGIESVGQGVGLGLGLHISRGIIERHGGQVGVESAPGEGSAFWFTLPLARDK